MMLRRLFHPLFLLSVSLYIGVRLWRLSEFSIPSSINGYVTDLVCMPIILTLCLIGVRVLKKVPHYELNAVQIFSMTAFYAILFEYYLPSSNSIYTADFFDVIAYFTGATIYYFVFQQSFRVKMANK